MKIHASFSSGCNNLHICLHFTSTPWASIWITHFIVLLGLPYLFLNQFLSRLYLRVTFWWILPFWQKTCVRWWRYNPRQRDSFAKQRCTMVLLVHSGKFCRFRSSVTVQFKGVEIGSQQYQWQVLFCWARKHQNSKGGNLFLFDHWRTRICCFLGQNTLEQPKSNSVLQLKEI